MAQVRLCDRAFIPAAIVRRGDSDAGTVLVKINCFENGVTVYTQASTLDGEPGWSRGTGPKPVTEPEADAYCGSTVTGSMVLPLCRTSKCRRGSVAPPEVPALAMTWPFLTASPFFTSSSSL